MVGYVPNVKEKRCQSCKFYKPYRNLLFIFGDDFQFAKCLRLGEYSGEYASINRRFESDCGSKAKYYIEAEKKKPWTTRLIETWNSLDPWLEKVTSKKFWLD